MAIGSRYEDFQRPELFRPTSKICASGPKEKANSDGKQRCHVVVQFNVIQYTYEQSSPLDILLCSNPKLLPRFTLHRLGLSSTGLSDCVQNTLHDLFDLIHCGIALALFGGQ